MTDLKSMTTEELEGYFKELGQPKFRAMQVFRWLHRGVESFDGMTNLPKALRACYHQEACNGFNYQRASEETMDICLRKLFARLSEQSYRRAEALMALLGRLVC